MNLISLLSGLAATLTISIATEHPPRAPDAANDGNFPRVIDAHAPVYPASAIKARNLGVVRIRTVLWPGGTVREASPIRPSWPLLDRAAQDAAMRWHFEPAAAGGTRELVLEFAFRLDRPDTSPGIVESVFIPPSRVEVWTRDPLSRDP